jgi:N-methylhydantoinase A
MTAWRAGIDIGGTFTDIVLLSEAGTVRTRKVPSTVDDYARGIVEGLAALLTEAGVPAGALAAVLHATTIGSNAVVERGGARTGLITTEGFRDTLEIRDLRMPRLYDLGWTKPPPLVPRRHRLGIAERTRADGSIAREPDAAEVERAVAFLLSEGIESLAVCLINAHANGANERAVAEAVARVAPDLPVSLSHAVLPEIKEYPRTSTTVINAYLLPVVRAYLARLRNGLSGQGIAAPVMLMQSNGGLLAADQAAALPMTIVESGPAAGVIGARALARRLGLPRIVTFDMGGTTAKAAMVEEGEAARAAEFQVGGGIMQGSRLLTGGGYTLKVPAIDLAEVGAGGGSIVSLDAGGAPKVGPRSAGAHPGPVCYGEGGTEPTITDCALALGWLDPAGLAGGAIRLDRAAAEAAIAGRIARALGLSLEDAAHGMLRIAVATMMRAIRAVSVERGRDPRQFALFAFGGNGPLFGALMAEELGMSAVVVPPAPGLFSAFGLLYAEVEHHLSATFRTRLDRADAAAFAAARAALEAEADARLAADGFPPARRAFAATAELRYVGQSSELPVPLLEGAADAVLASLPALFAAAHERAYGYAAGPDEPVEIVALRMIGRGIPERPPVPERVTTDHADTPRGVRRAFFGAQGWHETPVLGRAEAMAGVVGPAIVAEYDATCLVPPGWCVGGDEAGNLLLSRAG